MSDDDYFNWLQGLLVKGQEEVFRKSLLNDPSIKTLKNSFGHTLLHFAAVDCEKTMIDMLLEEGFDINATSKEDNTPLMYLLMHRVLSKDRVAIALHFLKKGSKVLISSSNFNPELKNNAMVYCVYKEDLPIVNKMFEVEPNLDINLPNVTGETVFTRFFNGNRSLPCIWDLFLSKGADVNATEYHSGNTALHNAVQNVNVKGVKYLLALPQINRTILNKDGKTAFQMAFESKDRYPEVFQLFL